MEIFPAPISDRTPPKEWTARSTAVPEDRPELGRNLTFGLLESLGRAIVTGAFDDEPFPVNAELVRRYGVSQSVTRVAVKMLTAKGLLTARPRQGTLVQPVSSWNLFDPDVLRWLLNRRLTTDLLCQLNQLRAAVEPEAASLAARKASEEDFSRLEQGLERIAARERRDDRVPATAAFHVAVLRATQNPFYVQFRDVVSAPLQTSIRVDSRFRGDASNIEDYMAVFAAIRTRDPGKARAAMRTLIDGTLGRAARNMG